MSTEDNKKLVNSMWTACEAGDFEALGKAYAANISYHGPGPTDMSGREDVVNIARGYVEAFPDLKFTIIQQIAEGDSVFTRAVVSGTNTGSLMGAPATGKSLTMEVAHVVQIANGEVVAEWETFDQLGMMQQLGMVG
jgi:steroid delta-isomerase-like uncharacterized protein